MKYFARALLLAVGLGGAVGFTAGLSTTFAMEGQEKPVAAAPATGIAAEPMAGESSLEQLPHEVQAHIYQNLAPRDLGTIAGVSRSVKGPAEDDSVWRARFHRDFSGREGHPAEGQSWKAFYKETVAQIKAEEARARGLIEGGA